jgi:ketosteroid isomerase-like protein
MPCRTQSCGRWGQVYKTLTIIFDKKRKMKYLLCLLIGSFIFLACSTNKSSFSNEDDIKAFKKLRNDLGLAFINGDIQTITLYHHPDVVKALSYNKFLVGRDANITDLKATLQSYSLNFKEHNIESFQIHGNTATEISSFTIEGTPKGDSKPFIFKGRSMVLYIRHKESPAGWALIREMVQAP